MQQPVEVQVDEHEQLVERVAAVDATKASGMVYTRVLNESVPGRRVTRVTPSTRALVELGDHLRCPSRLPHCSLGAGRLSSILIVP